MFARRGPGLVRAAATTAVVAGTAGAVRHRQDQKYAAQDQAARTCTGIESGLELSGQCDLSKRLTKRHVISTGRLLGFTSYSSRGMGSPLLQLIAAPTNVDAQSNLGPTANATTAQPISIILFSMKACIGSP